MCYDQEKTQAPGRPADLDFERMKLNQEKAMWADGANAAGGQLGRALTETEILAELFSYHPPTPHTLPKFAAINQAAKNFAEVVLQNCPRGSDRSAAIGSIRLARMIANAAIALNGLSL
jgi:hypothetical protein